MKGGNGDVSRPLFKAERWLMNLSDDDKKWFETVMDRGSAGYALPMKPILMRGCKSTVRRSKLWKPTLLTEFHKWASPTELRIQSHAQAIRAIDLELENVKERVSKLEPKQ